MWGDLDYLVIDMPPGTGDIHITLGQEIKMDGALIVTTPQDLSYVDVIKGIEMFDDLKVPTISIVENMAYHTCSKCGHPEHIFGPGKIEQIKKQFGIKTSFELPLLTEVSRYCDKGVPPLFAFPEEHDYCQRFFSIAKSFDAELQKVKEEKKDVHFNYETGKQEVVFSHGDKKVVIPAMQLRLRCQCAGCVDELSGKRILNDARVPRDVHPTQMIRKGNYAVAIMWSDGHKSSIYPFESVFAMGNKG